MLLNGRLKGVNKQVKFDGGFDSCGMRATDCSAAHTVIRIATACSTHHDRCCTTAASFCAAHADHLLIDGLALVIVVCVVQDF